MNTGPNLQQESAKPPAKEITPGLPLYVLDSAAGMASNQVHRLASDNHLRIWMATPVGLARFDGSFIQQWDRHTGLQCNGLRCVAIDGEATVWIGTDLGFDRLDTSGRPLPGAELGSWHRGLCQHIDVSTANPWIGTAQGLVKLERRSDKAGFQIAYSADIGFVSDIKSNALVPSGYLPRRPVVAWWKPMAKRGGVTEVKN